MIGAGEGIKQAVRNFLTNETCQSIIDKYPRFEDAGFGREDGFCALKAELGNSEFHDLPQSFNGLKFSRVSLNHTPLLIFQDYVRIEDEWRYVIVRDFNADGLIDQGDTVKVGGKGHDSPTLLKIYCDYDQERNLYDSPGIMEPLVKAYTSALRAVGLIE